MSSTDKKTDLLKQVHEKFKIITEYLIEKDIRVSVMESCTSGFIASLITDTQGASAIFRQGFVTYSNEAKIASGVPGEIIENHGVYSQKTADAMACASGLNTGSDIGIGITGTFGNPDPSNPDSVPGEVFLSVSCGGKCNSIGKEGLFNRYLKLESRPDRFSYKLVTADALADFLISDVLSIS